MAGPAALFRAALFSRTKGKFVLSLTFVLLLGVWQMASGQDVDPQVRHEALEAFHGPDLEGKDGPLAKAGYDLVLLYYEWAAYREQSTESDFTPSASSLPVSDGRVTVDATAARDPAALRDSLKTLGLTSSAQAGPVVSGQLPIAAIPDAARLSNLRAMRPARAKTHQRPSPTASNPAVESTSSPDEQSASSSESSRNDWIWGGVAAALVAGWLLLYLLRR